MKQRITDERTPEVVLFMVVASPDGIKVRGSQDLNIHQRLALAEVLRLAAEGMHSDLFDDFLGGGEDG